MNVTIATHNGSSAHREHNVRNIKVVSKEKHIDLNRTHEIWIDEKPRKAYDRLFGDSVKSYNKNQTREDRKIKDYYKSICKDKKKHPVYEMIIGIYGKDENGAAICDENTGKAIMKEFVSTWKERNPNLEIIGAYYHADEEGEPHVHIDYIPVAHGYTRGMETQTGLVKALGEMGFQKQGKATAQIQWEARENKILEDICRLFELTVYHSKDKKKHIDTELYKKEKELMSLNDEISHLKALIDRLTPYREKYAEISNMNATTNIREIKKKINKADLMIKQAQVDEAEKVINELDDLEL